jgi:hypothetical protein
MKHSWAGPDDLDDNNERERTCRRCGIRQHQHRYGMLATFTYQLPGSKQWFSPVRVPRCPGPDATFSEPELTPSRHLYVYIDGHLHKVWSYDDVRTLLDATSSVSTVKKPWTIAEEISEPGLPRRDCNFNGVTPDKRGDTSD